MKHYLYVLFLFLPLPTSSQERFNKICNAEATWQSGEGIVQLKDGGYLIASTDIPDFPESYIEWIRTDATGAMVHRSMFQKNRHYFSLFKNCLKPCLDGMFILAGTDYNVDTWEYKTILIKTDENGTPLWSKTFGVDAPPHEMLLFGLDVLPNGDLVFCGSYQDTFNVPSQMFVCKTDSQGAVIWQKKFNDTVPEVASQITFTADGGLALTFLRQETTPDKEYYVLKLDSLGNTLWEEKLSNTFAKVAWPSISAQNDGTLLFVGGQDSISQISNAFAAKLAPDGTVIWSKRYSLNDGNTSFFTSPIILPDGSFIIAGGPRVDSEYWKGGQLHLVRIDQNGDQVWQQQHYYLPNWVHDGRAMIPTTDGGYALAGLLHHSSVHNIWLLKVDSLGCAIENCATTDTEQQAIPHTGNELSVYPNPVSGWLHAKLLQPSAGSVRLSSIDGKIWREMTLTAQQAVNGVEIDMGRWPAGTYLLSVQTSDAQFQKLLVKL